MPVHVNLLTPKRLSGFLLALLVGGLGYLPTPAAAQTPEGQETGRDRAVPEIPARPRVPVYDPGLPINRKALKNGVVLLVQEQRTSERVAATVALRMGLLYETPETAGLSQVLMRSLKAGTQKYSPTDLQIRLLAHKITLQSGAGADYGQLEMETEREGAEAGLELLSEIVLRPSFPDTAVENARTHFLAKAAEDVENPLLGTYSMFLSAMYRGTPFVHPPHGAVQALTEARRSDILALHKRFFVGGNIVVAVVGNVDSKKTMTQLERLFAGAPAGAAPAPPASEPFPLERDSLITAERPILAQSLVYGYPAPGYNHPDYPAFMIIDSYLRSADRSPITYWLPQREQAAAVGVIYPPYPNRSSIAVHLASQTQTFRAARDTVATVLARLKTETLDEGEWGVQLKRVQNGFFMKQNEPIIRARNLSRWEVQGVTTEYPRTFETALLKLKPEDVRDAAAKWFTHSREVSWMPARDGQP
jgi:zinc protease